MCDLAPLQWRFVSDSEATNPELSKVEFTDLETIKKIILQFFNGRATKNSFDRLACA